MDTVCELRNLPPTWRIDAAVLAIRENPANAPLVMPRAEEDPDNPVLSPARLAALTSKYWRNSGVRLTVGFPFDNPTTACRRKILQHMNAWGSACNVAFVESAISPQVRIARMTGSGYWSYLGTDILSIPRNQPTMNLEGFTESTPDAEYTRVVRHETGHTLGFPHEHLRREIVNLLDPAKTVAYFNRQYGWDARTTTEQVLTPIEEGALLHTPSADLFSIMTYQIAGECTRSGLPIPGGLDIDESDFAFAAKLYPPIVTPPPPPPPGQTVITIDLARKKYSFPSDWKQE